MGVGGREVRAGGQGQGRGSMEKWTGRGGEVWRPCENGWKRGYKRVDESM